MINRSLKILGSAFLVATLAACGSTSSPIETSSTPSESATPEPVYLTAPLTGVQYLEGTNPYLALPAVMAKIDNTDSGRPQLELNRADVVYVTRVEGGMTRLLPVWHSDMPEDVGPVRSVRPIDAAIIAPYSGIFIYSGGQAPFKKAAAATGLHMADEDTEMDNDTYFRTDFKVAPWNLWFKARQLQSTHTEQPAPTTQFEFDASPTALTGELIEKIDIKFNYTHSVWEPGTASFPWAASAEPAWLRTQDGDPHVEHPSGEQVRAKNVVVLETESDNSFIDPKYGVIPKAKLENSTGVAHIFTDGYYLKAIWSKADIKSPIKLTTESGSAVKLAIGNTWVEIIDTAKVKFKVVKPEPVSGSEEADS